MKRELVVQFMDGNGENLMKNINILIKMVIKKKQIGSDKGFDQLQFIIDEIKNNPTSRRLFMSAWNPNQMKDMCLPPCHISYQFYVNNGYLSCQMYQRSADVFLGLTIQYCKYIFTLLFNCKYM